MARLIIYGCGGHSRSVADVILSNDPNCQLVFVDEHARPGETIFAFKAITAVDERGAGCIVAIGDNELRRKQFLTLRTADIATVVSNRAYVGRDAVIGRGAFIAHGAHLGPLVRIGANTIVNTNATVD